MRLLRLSQAAREADLSVSTIRRLIRSGVLRAYRPAPHSVRVCSEELARYVASTVLPCRGDASVRDRSVCHVRA